MILLTPTSFFLRHGVEMPVRRSVRLGFVGLLFGAVLPATTTAATLTPTSSGGRNGLVITGTLLPSDAERFENMVRDFQPGDFVAMHSDGGALLAGLRIGRLIRSKGLTTLVTSSSICTSACALMWVAGTRRLLMRGGRVGFHAAYSEAGGRLVEIGAGNAMVGRYLTLLGLPERSIIFATLASPDRIAWLRPEDRARTGIDFELVEPSGERTTQGALRAKNLGPVEVSREVGAWRIFGLSNDCFASLTSGKGTELVVSLRNNPEERLPLYLALYDDSWSSIENDREYGIVMEVGGRQFAAAASGHRTTNLKGIAWLEDHAAILALRSARRLSFSRNGREIAIFLEPNIDSALEALVDCQRQLGRDD